MLKEIGTVLLIITSVSWIFYFKEIYNAYRAGCKHTFEERCTVPVTSWIMLTVLVLYGAATYGVL